jgi:hypothetical protein
MTVFLDTLWLVLNSPRNAVGYAARGRRGSGAAIVGRAMSAIMQAR